MLSKFYIKDRSVQVVMEQCSESSVVHKILIGFINEQLFEPLNNSDYFGFMMLRAGRKPI
jgi:hypothetical protein